MSLVTNTLNYLDDDVVLEGFFAFDDTEKGRKPAVIIAHTWCGRNAFVEDKARQLAECGYVGFALDMYGKGILGSTPEQNAALMQPFMDDREKLRKRIIAALRAIRQLPWVDDSRIAAIGYCFGGLCVLDLARSGEPVKGVVSLHGLLDPPENISNPPMRAKVLALHGYDDPMGPVPVLEAFQEEMTRADVDWQVHVYGKTMHAFTNPQANNPDFGTVYNALADQRSWQSTLSFLQELFV